MNELRRLRPSPVVRTTELAQVSLCSEGGLSGKVQGNASPQDAEAHFPHFPPSERGLFRPPRRHRVARRGGRLRGRLRHIRGAMREEASPGLASENNCQKSTLHAIPLLCYLFSLAPNHTVALPVRCPAMRPLLPRSGLLSLQVSPCPVQIKVLEPTSQIRYCWAAMLMVRDRSRNAILKSESEASLRL